MKEQLKNMLLKEVMENPACMAALEKVAPQLSRFPLGMVASKKIGEVMEMAVSMKILDAATRDKIVDALQEALGI